MAETRQSINQRASDWLSANHKGRGEVQEVNLPLGFVVNIVERLDRLRPLEEAYALGFADCLGKGQEKV